MKVLHINEYLALTGGVETYLFSLIPMLNKKGFNSVVAFGKGDLDFSGETYQVPQISQAGFKHQNKAYGNTKNVLFEAQPDLIHIHNVQNVGIVKASLEYGPTILTTHDHRWACPANTFFYNRTQEICHRTCGPGCFATTVTKHCLTPRPNYAAYFYYRVKWGIKHSQAFSHLISPSNATKNRHVAAGISENQITPLPYFCSLTPRKEPRKIPEKQTITYLGRISENKGFGYFIEALGKLPNNVQGILVGNLTTESKAIINRKSKQNGCFDRLYLRNWASREELINILDQTSVLIFPSLCVETLGIVGLEALSRGVPVVASDVGGIREWCKDGTTGYVVPPKDSDGINGAIQNLLEDKEQLLEFGQNGIELIKEKFLPQTHLKTLLKIYEKSIGST